MARYPAGAIGVGAARRGPYPAPYARRQTPQRQNRLPCAATASEAAGLGLPAASSRFSPASRHQSAIRSQPSQKRFHTRKALARGDQACLQGAGRLWRRLDKEITVVTAFLEYRQQFRPCHFPLPTVDAPAQLAVIV